MRCYIISIIPEYDGETMTIPAKENLVHKLEYLWKMFFDGAGSWEGMGAEVILIPPIGKNISLSYKLEFDTTNNVPENEALILGLKTTRKMGVKYLTVFGNSELVVLQVRNIYTTKHLWMRSYRNDI